MKSKRVLVLLTIILSLCVGCTSTMLITMPYGSDEYVNGDWTIEDLEKHFGDLGFEEVEVCGNTTEIMGVYVENEDSLYDSFEKGDEIESSRKIGIYTYFEEEEPLSVDNSSEFAEFVESGIESLERQQEWLSFLETNDGKILEFDGTITDWYDDVFWVSVSFDIAIEDSEKLSFSKSTVALIDLGMTGEYDYKKYYAGLITEGMRVHVITKITKVDDEWELELDSMQVIE